MNHPFYSSEGVLNPDVLCRLAGRENIGKTILNNLEVTTLYDAGAQISIISEELCDLMHLEVNPLGDLLSVKGTGWSVVPYIGFVEANLKIPGVQKFDHDCLFLVIPTNPGHEEVPLQIGTTVLDQMVEDITDEELKSSSQVLKTSYVSCCAARRSTQVKDCLNSFSLEQVKGSVKTTKKVVIPAFSTIEVSGMSKVKGHSKKVHIIVEGSQESKLPSSILVTNTYGQLQAGSSRVHCGIRNVSAKAVTIPAKTIIGEVSAANKIPDILLPKPGFSEREQEQGSTNQNAAEKDKDDGQWLLDELDLKGLDKWSDSQKKQAIDLLKKNSHIFAKGDLDLGKTSIIKHKIELTDYTPFKERYRRIPPHMYNEVKDHIQEMLDIGAIKKSFSPWASAVVLVRKKDGKLRFCIDLRRLNCRTVKDSYAIPRIEETLDCLQGAVWFSSLDLKAGYWQVEMDEDSKQFTAFTVGPLGFYECERMPFGLTNAPATFQRLMETCLDDLHLQWCLIYLDDIVIFSKTPEEHLKRIDAVLQQLHKAGLKLKPSKCRLFQEEISYLGHVVSKDGIATDPAKIEVVKNWKVPTTVTEVKSFLGFVSYYRRFIPKFSMIARPLHKVTSGEIHGKGKAKVPWDDKCQKAFETLKQACCQAPILGYADFNKPFILHTDASGDGLGAVLYQEQDGKERVIAYASRSLSKSERNYPSHKLEFLALKWAITDKFHEYLYGAPTFEVYTDNNPLTYVLTTAKLDATGQRWVASLANYNFTLHYRSGKSNRDADVLSRFPACLGPEVIKALSHAVRANSTLIESVSTDVTDLNPLLQTRCVANMDTDDWIRVQREDPILRQVINKLKDRMLGKYKIKSTDPPTMKTLTRQNSQLKLIKGVLFRKTKQNKEDRPKYQLVLPAAYYHQALVGCHDNVGHMGIEKTTELLKDRFYWPGMTNNIADHLKNCVRCRQFKGKTAKAPLTPIHATHPLELVHMDYLEIEPSKGNIENVLVITDHFTRYAQAYTTKSQTAVTTAKMLWDNFILHYGFPEKFISDQGRNFESKLIAELCDLAGVKKVRTSPYHPQTNGQCERFNGTLINMLGTLDPKEKVDWKTKVSTLVHAYNCTRNTATGFSPYFLMFGREPRLPIDVEMGLGGPSVVGEPTKSKYVTQLKRRMMYAHEQASKQSVKEKDRQKRLYDRKARGAALAIHDIVLVKVTAWKGRHKIQDRWNPIEYKVVDQPHEGVPVYKVEPVGGGKSKVLHRNLLLPIGRAEEEEEEVIVSFPPAQGKSSEIDPVKETLAQQPSLESQIEETQIKEIEQTEQQKEVSTLLGDSKNATQTTAEIHEQLARTPESSPVVHMENRQSLSSSSGWETIDESTQVDSSEDKEESSYSEAKMTTSPKQDSQLEPSSEEAIMELSSETNPDETESLESSQSESEQETKEEESVEQIEEDEPTEKVEQKGSPSSSKEIEVIEIESSEEESGESEVEVEKSPSPKLRRGTRVRRPPKKYEDYYCFAVKLFPDL